MLSKTDLVAPDALAATRGWLREIVGRSTAMVDARHGDLPVDVVLGTRDGSLGGGGSPRVAHGHERDHPDYETWAWSRARPA